LRSWDTYVGLGAGAVAGGLMGSDAVRGAAVAVLLAEAAIGIALTATVLGAVAIFATFFDANYRRVLDLAGGFRSALMPYITVSVIAAAAGLCGLLSALALPALQRDVAAAVVALSTLLCAWATAGTVSLVELTLFHATQRASLMAGADDAAQLLGERRQRRVVG
jgi:hypothetical protein